MHFYNFYSSCCLAWPLTVVNKDLFESFKLQLQLVYLQQCKSQGAQKSKQAKTVLCISNSTLLLLGFKLLLTDIIWPRRLSCILYCFYLILHLMSLAFTMNQWSKHTFYTNKENKAPIMSLSLLWTRHLTLLFPLCLLKCQSLAVHSK